MFVHDHMNSTSCMRISMLTSGNQRSGRAKFRSQWAAGSTCATVGRACAYVRPSALLAASRSFRSGRMYTRTASDFQLPCSLMCRSSTPALAASVAAPARIEWNPYASGSVTPIALSHRFKHHCGVFTLSRLPVTDGNSGPFGIVATYACICRTMQCSPFGRA